jgi:hypothetical protein
MEACLISIYTWLYLYACACTCKCMLWIHTFYIHKNTQICTFTSMHSHTVYTHRKPVTRNTYTDLVTRTRAGRTARSVAKINISWPCDCDRERDYNVTSDSSQDMWRFYEAVTHLQGRHCAYLCTAHAHGHGHGHGVFSIWACFASCNAKRWKKEWQEGLQEMSTLADLFWITCSYSVLSLRTQYWLVFTLHWHECIWLHFLCWDWNEVDTDRVAACVHGQHAKHISMYHVHSR